MDRFLTRQPQKPKTRQLAITPADVAAEAERQGIDPLLAVSIAKAESQGNTKALSPVGARGIMQVMPETGRKQAAKLGERYNPNDAAQNVRLGVAELKDLQGQFGDDYDAIAAGYNAGPGAVRKHGGIPPYKETRAYVPRVRGNYEQLQQAMGGGLTALSRLADETANDATPAATGNLVNLEPARQQLIRTEQAKLGKPLLPAPQPPAVSRTASAKNTVNTARALPESGEMRLLTDDEVNAQQVQQPKPVMDKPLATLGAGETGQLRKLRIDARTAQALTKADDTQAQALAKRAFIGSHKGTDREAAQFLSQFVPDRFLTERPQVRQAQGGAEFDLVEPEWWTRGLEAYRKGGATAALEQVRSDAAALQQDEAARTAAQRGIQEEASRIKAVKAQGLQLGQEQYGGGVGGGLKAALASASGGISDMLYGAGSLPFQAKAALAGEYYDPSQLPETLKQIRDDAVLAQAAGSGEAVPQAGLLRRYAGAAGSTIPYLVGGAATGGSKLAIAGLGAAQNASALTTEAISANATPGQVQRAYGLGGLVGAGEALGFTQGLNVAKGGLRGVAKEIGKEAVEEGLQEGGSQIANNLVASTGAGYAPERKWHEGALESAIVGAVLGAGMAGTQKGLGAAAERLQRTPQQAAAVGAIFERAGIVPEALVDADPQFMRGIIEEARALLDLQGAHQAALQQVEAAQPLAQRAAQRQAAGFVPTPGETQAAQTLQAAQQEAAAIEAQYTVSQQRLDELAVQLRYQSQVQQMQAQRAQQPAQPATPVLTEDDLFAGLEQQRTRAVVEQNKFTPEQSAGIETVPEQTPDLLKAVRQEGGMAATEEAGELRKLGRKEAATTGIVNQKTGLHPDEVRHSLKSEGLTKAETVDDFLQEVENEVRVRNRRAVSDEWSDEAWARHIERKAEDAAEYDQIDAWLSANPETEALFHKSLFEGATENEQTDLDRAIRDAFGDDFANSVYHHVGRNAKDRFATYDQNNNDASGESSETVTTQPERPEPEQLTPRGNPIPEWMRNRNIYQMDGAELTEFARQLREEKSRQSAAGRDTFDRGRVGTTDDLLEAATERRKELRKAKVPVPRLDEAPAGGQPFNKKEAGAKLVEQMGDKPAPEVSPYVRMVEANADAIRRLETLPADSDEAANLLRGIREWNQANGIAKRHYKALKQDVFQRQKEGEQVSQPLAPPVKSQARITYKSRGKYGARLYVDQSLQAVLGKLKGQNASSYQLTDIFTEAQNAGASAAELRAIEQAKEWALENKRTVPVVVAGRAISETVGTRFHEALHSWASQYRPQGRLLGDEIKQTRHWNKIKDALAGRATDGTVETEALAYIGALQHEKVGITPTIAQEWLGDYLTKVANKYGLKVLDTLLVRAGNRETVKQVREQLAAAGGTELDKRVAALKTLLVDNAPAEKTTIAETPAHSSKLQLSALTNAMRAVEPQATTGALVSLTRLRKQFPELNKEQFDEQILQHARNGEVTLHRHDFVASLSPEEQAGLVKDDRGNYYVGAALEAQPQAQVIEQAAHEAATSPQNDLPEPTQAQKEAGNYKKGHITWNGLDISIENPKGSKRSGVDAGGKPWEVEMTAHYGYIRGSEGADGDQVDIYMGEHPDSDRVFVVDQMDLRTGKFDEHKIVLGARTAAEATELYKAHFSDGKGAERMGGLSDISVDQFKEWLKAGKTTHPMAVIPKAKAQANTPQTDRPTVQNVPSANKKIVYNGSTAPSGVLQVRGKPLSVGEYVQFQEPVPIYKNGEVAGSQLNKRRGRVEEIMPDGQIVVRAQMGGMRTLDFAELTPERDDAAAPIIDALPNAKTGVESAPEVKNGLREDGNRSALEREPADVSTPVDARDAEGVGAEPSRPSTGSVRKAGGQQRPGTRGARKRVSDGDGSATTARKGKPASEPVAKPAEPIQAANVEHIDNADARTDEQPPSAAHTAPDYVIENDESLYPSGSKAKLEANMAALRLLNELKHEGRQATAEEQAVLAQYTGWGQFPAVFNDFNDSGKPYTALRSELQALLGQEGYERARNSTRNAHYTAPAVVRAMWQMANRLGFTGGRVLEPSVGSGNFFGTMPSDLKRNARLTGVELDPSTAAIAKHLYPSANIQNAPFQEYTVPDGFFDFMIGNVPFGKGAIHDKRYNKFKPSIHNYFFLRSLDKLREGGVLAYITSAYTMDRKDSAIRAALAEKADLVAAIRLPGNTFKQNAGTSVVTDIVILRKRKAGETASAVNWMGVKEVNGADGKPQTINEYFAAHPENILGNLDSTGSMNRDESMNVSRTEDFEERLAAAIERLPKVWEKAAVTSTAFKPETRMAPPSARESATVIDGEKIFRVEQGVLVERKLEGKAKERVKAMMKLRDIGTDVLAVVRRGDEAPSLRAQLRNAYDQFVGKHGFLHDAANARLLAEDADGPIILALEKWDADKKKGTPADLALTPAPKNVEPRTFSDAVALSLFEAGKLDIALMAERMGKSDEEIIKGLSDDNLAFDDPQKGWQVREEYLSGNVREKLAHAKAAAAVDPRYARNVGALEAVQPADIEHFDIGVKMGAPWIPISDMQQFVQELLGLDDANGLELLYQPLSAKWSFNFKSNADGRRASSSKAATTLFSTKYTGFSELLRGALQDTPMMVKLKDADGKEYVDKEATTAANSKVAEIRDRFKEWLWEDDERRIRLARYYNDNFNNIVARKYSGAHYIGADGKVILPGANPAITLRPAQLDGVYRAVTHGKGIFGYEVGVGKTMTMVAAAMELKRLGLAKKPVITMPKKTMPGFAAQARALYPGANMLIIEDHFTADKRKQAAAQIATNDYDLILMTYEHFKALPVKPEWASSFIQDEINEATDAWLEARGADGKNKGNKVVKELEARIDTLNERLKELLEGAGTDDAVFFEDLGVDAVFVDEFHNFKALPVYTSLSRIKGIPTTKSQRATDMLMKMRWIQQQTGGRNVFGATGTPITNTIAEVYNLQRFFQMDELGKRGIKAFDAWTKSYGELEHKVERTVSGKYEPTTRFSKFTNLRALQPFVREILDVVYARDVDEIILPKRKEIVEEVELSAEQAEYNQKIGERADKIKTGRVEPRDDNMLKISGDATKLALDQRLVGMPGSGNGKVERVVENILKIQREHPGTVQLVFSDTGVHEATAGFSVFNEITRMLISAGVPKDKILNFSDMTDAKLQTAAKRLYDGDALIGMGSTKTIGTGVNVQQHLKAVHHLDSTWKPDDVEQRDGRIIRQGNTQTEGLIYRYVTVGSFDAYKWQAVDKKAKFIRAFMQGSGVANEIKETDDETLSEAQVMALASGDPDLMIKVQLDEDLQELRSKYRNHQRQQTAIKNSIFAAKAEIERRSIELAEIKADVETYNAAKDAKVMWDFNGKSPETADLRAVELMNALRDMPHNKDVALAKYRNLTLYANRTFNRAWLAGAPDTIQYGVKYSAFEPGAIIASAEAVARMIPTSVAGTEKSIAQLEKDIPRLESQLGKPFKEAAEMEEKERQLKEVEARMEAKSKPAPTEDEAAEEAEAPAASLSFDADARLTARETGTQRSSYTPVEWEGISVSSESTNAEIYAAVRSYYQPAQPGKNSLGVVFGNKATSLLMHEAYLRTVPNSKLARFAGLAIPPHDVVKLAQGLSRIAAERGASQSVRGLVQQLLAAQGDNPSRMVFYVDADLSRSAAAIDNTVLHEVNVHGWQYALDQRDMSLTGADWMANDPDFEQLADSLKRKGYHPTPQLVAVEALAHIGSGNWKSMGYADKAQAVDFVYRYLSEVARRYGVAAITRVQLQTGLQEGVERAINERTNIAGASTAVRSGAGSGTIAGAFAEGIDTSSPSSNSARVRRAGNQSSNFADDQGDIEAPAASRGIAANANPREILAQAAVTVKQPTATRPARLYANDQFMALARLVLGKLYGQDYGNATALNLTTAQLGKLAHTLSTAGKTDTVRGKLEGLANQLHAAVAQHPQSSWSLVDASALNAQGTIEAGNRRAQMRQDIREEQFHWSQRQIDGKSIALTGATWAARNLPARARRNLIARGYGENPELLAAEYAAQIAAGQWDNLNLSTDAERDKALAWLAGYFARVAEVHGRDALKQFRHLPRVAAEAKTKGQELYDGRGTAGGTASRNATATGAPTSRAGDRGSGETGRARPSRDRVPQEPGGGRGSERIPSPDETEATEAWQAKRFDGQTLTGTQSNLIAAPTRSTGTRPAADGLVSISDKEIDRWRWQVKTALDALTDQKRFDVDLRTAVVTEINAAEAAIRANDGVALLQVRQRMVKLLATRPTWRARVLDLLNGTKAFKASFDLSYPLRQGAIATLNVRNFFNGRGKDRLTEWRNMLAAISAGNYDRMQAELRNHPLYDLAEDVGLHLVSRESLKIGASATKKEESFTSAIAEKIPGIAASERAYTMAADTQRMQMFDVFVRELERVGVAFADDPQSYRDVATFVNNITGRGELHKSLESLEPVLALAMFSPRYLASRVTIMNPLYYKRMTGQARRVAMREMAGFFSMLAIVGMGAVALGAQVGFDPEETDFLKIKVGNTRYDLLAGLQQVGVFGWRVLERLSEHATGGKPAKGERPIGTVVERFARSKASPSAGYLYDWLWSGKNFKGEKFSHKDAAPELITPIMVKDFYEAFTQEGWLGVVETAPSVVGVSVNTYRDKGTPARKPSAKYKNPAQKQMQEQRRKLREAMRP